MYNTFVDNVTECEKKLEVRDESLKKYLSDHIFHYDIQELEKITKRYNKLTSEGYLDRIELCISQINGKQIATMNAQELQDAEIYLLAKFKKSPLFANSKINIEYFYRTVPFDDNKLIAEAMIVECYLNTIYTIREKDIPLMQENLFISIARIIENVIDSIVICKVYDPYPVQ